MENNTFDPLLAVNEELILSCSQNEVDQVKELIQKDAKVNWQRNDGVSPLWEASCQNNVDIMKILLEQNANVNLQANDGTTPLYIASESGSYEAAEILLKEDAKVELSRDDETTPIWAASCRGYTSVVELLYKYKANVNVKQSTSSKTCLHVAIEKGRPQVAKYLIGKNIDIHAKMKNGETPLHTACRYKRPDIVDTLLGNCANKDSQNDRGETPLIIACERGNREIVKKLIAHGADINIESFEKNCGTALHYAAANNRFKTLRILLSNKAKLLRNSEGHLPSDVAKLKGHTTLHSFLKTIEIKSMMNDLQDSIISSGYEQKETVEIKSMMDDLQESIISSGYGSDSDASLSEDEHREKYTSIGKETKSKGSKCHENEGCQNDKHTSKVTVSQDIDESEAYQIQISAEGHMSDDDKKELEDIYSKFVKAISCIEDEKRTRNLLYSYKGKRKKQIFVGVKSGKRETATEFLKEKCQDFWNDDIFEIQEEEPSEKKLLVREYHNKDRKCVTILSENNFYSSFIGLGSIGCIGEDSEGKKYVITAKHIFETDPSASNATIYRSKVNLFDEYVSSLDRSCSSTNFMIGQLFVQSRYFGIHGGVEIANKPWVVDIALVPIPESNNCDPDLSNENLEIEMLEYPTDLLVTKTGAKSGTTYGFIVNSDFNDMQISRYGRNVIVVKAVKNLIIENIDKPKCELDVDGYFAKEGDSGALVKSLKAGSEDRSRAFSKALGMVYMLSSSYTDRESGMRYQNVTYCVRMDACLEALRKRWGFQLNLYQRVGGVVPLYYFKPNNRDQHGKEIRRHSWPNTC